MVVARGVCPTSGCPNLRPCPTHQRKPWAGSTRRQRLPPDWERRRQAALTRDQHTCRACGARATEVDHINRGDDHQLANLQSLCHPCHRTKTQTEAAAARR